MVPPARSVAVALLGVAVLVGAAGGTAYYLHQQPVSTDYEVPRDAAVPFDHYESHFAVSGAGSSTGFVVNRTVTPGRTALRIDWRTDEGRNLVRRVTVGAFDYVVHRPASDRRFRAENDHEPTRWVASDPAGRTVYAVEWHRDADGGYLTAPYFADRFAYRKTGEITYHGVPAETYAVKSWWLPRETDTWKGSGRLVVAAETGALLRLSATTTRGDERVRVEHRKVPVEAPERPPGEAVVRAVRRNVTVNTSVYPDRYGTDPAAYALQSGDVVGVEFDVEDAAPPLPAGARVVATDRNGTTFATTLERPFGPEGGADPVLDLAFAVEDGSLSRTEVGGEAGPLRRGPDLRRLVVRDPESGWTYVNATVRGEGVADVRVESRETREGYRYARIEASPGGGGTLHYRLEAPDGTVAGRNVLRANGSVALAWIDHDSVWALQERPDDELVSAPNGATTERYRLVITGPRGRLADATVRLDRPLPNASAS